MYRQILVPLDGSEQAERAVEIAGRLARRAGGNVTLIQVVGADVAHSADAVPVRLNTRNGRDIQLSPEEYLLKLSQGPELANVPTETVILQGVAAERIVSEAERRAADLIVLSHRRHGTTAAIVFGSVADDVMRRAQMPVLLLHADATQELAEAEAEAAKRTVRALVPLDGSRFAEQALQPAIDLLRTLETGHGAALHLTYVIDPKHAFRYDTPETEAMRNARTYLEEITERIKNGTANAPIEVSWTVETDEEVAAGIERVAVQGAYGLADFFDFVAIATHSRAGVAYWMEGSVTEKLAHTMHAPVLIVHPGQQAEAVSVTMAEIQGEGPWPAIL